MAVASVGLSTYIWNNNLRSVALLVSYPVLLAGMIWACCFVCYYAFASAALPQGTGEASVLQAAGAASGLLVEFAPAIAAAVAFWFFVSWFWNANMIRIAAHSRPVSREEAPGLYNLLENLCIARGIAMPRLEIIETPSLNAFASGIDKRSHTITVTRGLLEALNAPELEAVLAHELTHILNRDVRLLMVTVVFTGMVGFAAQMAWGWLRHVGWVPRVRERQGAALLALLAVLAILWLGYMASMMTRFAISRRREFLADAGAVELTKNPEAMMGALLKIAGRDRIPDAPEDIAMMCTHNAQPLFGLFATHPPIGERVRAIAQISGVEMPQQYAAESQRDMPSALKGRNPWA